MLRLAAKTHITSTAAYNGWQAAATEDMQTTPSSCVQEHIRVYYVPTRMPAAKRCPRPLFAHRIGSEVLQRSTRPRRGIPVPSCCSTAWKHPSTRCRVPVPSNNCQRLTASLL